MKTLFKKFIGLFESNGLTPEPNSFKEDWVAEYHKIKDTQIMRGISVCLMQDGTYSVINSMPTHHLSKAQGLTKSSACRRAVEHYRIRSKIKRATTPVAEV